MGRHYEFDVVANCKVLVANRLLDPMAKLHRLEWMDGVHFLESSPSHVSDRRGCPAGLASEDHAYPGFTTGPAKVMWARSTFFSRSSRWSSLRSGLWASNWPHSSPVGVSLVTRKATDRHTVALPVPDSSFPLLRFL